MESLKVVLVDDQKFFLFLMEEMIAKVDITSDGIKIPVQSVSFSNPLEAYEYIKKNEVDMVISDYLLPGMDGLQLLRKIRELPGKSTVIFIMVTAEHAKRLKRKALEFGATDFLTKPLDRLEFIPKVRNLLKLRLNEKLLSDKTKLMRFEIEKKTRELKERDREIILRLSKAAEFRDDTVGFHIERVAEYSLLIAKEFGFDDDFCENLHLAAPLHDIGKIGIPDRILKKPSKLTPEEWEIMKKHTIYGYNILKGSKIPAIEMAAKVALYHHENWDGTGYPFGLKGEDIPICARIVSIADTFDALTQKRPYKEGWEIEKALDYIKKMKEKKFDPELADAFLRLSDKIDEVLQKYPLDAKPTDEESLPLPL